MKNISRFLICGFIFFFVRLMFNKRLLQYSADFRILGLIVDWDDLY